MPQKDAFISRLYFNGTHPAVMRSRPSPKQKITFSLPTALIERLRNAVYWTANRPLAGLVEEALEALVTQMEEVNREAFPQRLSPLKAGRRPGKRGPCPPTSSYTGLLSPQAVRKLAVASDVEYHAQIATEIAKEH